MRVTAFAILLVLAGVARAEPTITACAGEASAIEAAGLPAVSTDGARVVALVSAGDGGRGNPNFALLWIDPTTDRVVERLPLLDADEADHPACARLRKRAARANARLASMRWRRLRPLGALGPLGALDLRAS